MINVSEEVNFTATGNTTPSLPSFQRPPTLMFASTMLGLVTGVTGTCANAVVFVVLILTRKHFGSKVNTLITNQSAMDLMACICLTISNSLSVPGAPRHYLRLGEVANNIICFLFRNRVLAVCCMNAEKIGLKI